MAYLSTIPRPNDLLSQSQPQILGNFGSIQELIDVNHVDFSDATNQGKHKFVSFFPQTVAPTLNNTTDVIGYSFLNPNTQQNELYISKVNQATVTLIPSTASTLSISSAPSSGSGGWTYLPSGLLMVWGTFTGNGYTPFTLVPGISPAGTPTGFPGFTQILNVQVSQFANSMVDQNVAVQFCGISSPTTFNVYFAQRNSSGVAVAGGCTYLAIGY